VFEYSPSVSLGSDFATVPMKEINIPFFMSVYLTNPMAKRELIDIACSPLKQSPSYMFDKWSNTVAQREYHEQLSQYEC
jgi:hypothetical protein